MDWLAHLIAIVWDAPEFIRNHPDVVFLLLITTAILFVLLVPWNKRKR